MTGSLARMFLLGTLTLIANGCTVAANEAALCSRTDVSTTAHAAALAADGGPRSVQTGRTLIAMLDAGCRR